MEKISVRWANDEKNIILVTYHTNDWQWTDFSKAIAEQRALLDQTQAPMVHIIVDVTQSQLIPKGASILSASRNLSQDVHPKQGYTIIVGAHGFIAKMLDIVGNFLGEQKNKIFTTDTIEAAYEKLHQLLSQTPN